MIDTCSLPPNRPRPGGDSREFHPARWLRALAHQDLQAWALLVECYAPFVNSLSHAVLRRDEDADDAAQEIFIQLHHAAGSFPISDDDLHADAWIRRLATNCCLMWLRRVRSRRSHEIHDGTLVASLPAPEPVQQDDQPDLYLTIADLPVRHREPLVMLYLEGLTYGETARLLGCSPSTARVRVHRALKYLRSILRATHQHAAVGNIIAGIGLAPLHADGHRLSFLRYQHAIRPFQGQSAATSLPTLPLSEIIPITSRVMWGRTLLTHRASMALLIPAVIVVAAMVLLMDAHRQGMQDPLARFLSDDPVEVFRGDHAFISALMHSKGKDFSHGVLFHRQLPTYELSVGTTPRFAVGTSIPNEVCTYTCGYGLELPPEALRHLPRGTKIFITGVHGNLSDSLICTAIEHRTHGERFLLVRGSDLETWFHDCDRSGMQMAFRAFDGKSAYVPGVFETSPVQNQREPDPHSDTLDIPPRLPTERD